MTIAQELGRTAKQLETAMNQSKFGADGIAIRVKDPASLVDLLRRAATQLGR